MIDNFSGENRFLSNFYESEVHVGDILYPSAEHAYQAYKTTCMDTRLALSKLDTPGHAKKAGRLVTIRHNWDNMKLDVMRMVVNAKFSQSRELAFMLIMTEDAELIEGNTWGDTFWGVCRGRGENHLGAILMSVRAGIVR